jgi:hypothetical protein
MNRPLVNDMQIAAFEPEEILAFARRMDELARADASIRTGDWHSMLFNCSLIIVRDLEGLLNCAHDGTAERENWPQKDEDEDGYREWVTPPNWQHAIDAVGKIRTGLDDIIRERDERRYAQLRRQEEEEKAKKRKEKQIEKLRSRLRALEREAAEPEDGGGDA